MAAVAGKSPARGEAIAKRLRLILIPPIVSLCMTLLRLFGELGHWSERWFEPITRGIMPGGVGWVFGITWLVIPFRERYLTTAFIPQMIFWVAFTVMIGGLAGSLTALVRSRMARQP